MDDNEALLWHQSKRKRDLDKSERKKEKEEWKKQALETRKELEEEAEREGLEVPSTSDASKNDFDISKHELTKEQLQKDIDNEIIFTNEEIHMKLYQVDPAMAKRLHPNNRRKILR